MDRLVVSLGEVSAEMACSITCFSINVMLHVGRHLNLALQRTHRESAPMFVAEKATVPLGSDCQGVPKAWVSLSTVAAWLKRW